MPNWKKVIVSGSNAALNSLVLTNNITVSGSSYLGNSTSDSVKITGSALISGSARLFGPLYDNLGSSGTADQILFRSSTGGIEWRDNVANSAQDLVITGKNVGLTTIQKGTPLFFTASGTSGNIVGVLPANAGDINLMPAGGVAGESIAAGAEGDVYIYGYIGGVDTSTFSSGDDVYVAVGGGYTNIKPTGSALIQKLGNVEKSGVNGSGVIAGPSWYNDLPNWAAGRIMVGRSNGQPITSSFIYINENSDTLSITGSLKVSGSGQFYKTSSNYIQLLNDANTLTFSPNAASYIKYGSNIILAMKSGAGNATIMYGAGYPILSATQYGVKIGTNVDGSNSTAMLDVKGTLIVSSSLYQWNQNTDVDTGTETVISIATGSYRSVFFDYVVNKTTNARAGTVFAVWNGTTIEFTETSTNDIGTTSDLTLRASISGANVLLQATALSDNWSVKTLARLL